MPPAKSTRPKYYDLNLLHLPSPGLVSIFHRISGVLLFLLAIPLGLFLLQSMLRSESGFNFWKNVLSFPLVKLILLGFIWAYMHHFFAGIRYLLFDIHVWTAKAPSQRSAWVVLALGLIATLLIGVRIW